MYCLVLQLAGTQRHVGTRIYTPFRAHKQDRARIASSQISGITQPVRLPCPLRVTPTLDMRGTVQMIVLSAARNVSHALQMRFDCFGTRLLLPVRLRVASKEAPCLTAGDARCVAEGSQHPAQPAVSKVGFCVVAEQEGLWQDSRAGVPA